MEDFSLAGIPRDVPVVDNFCAPCSHVDNWITAGVRQGYWRDIEPEWWAFDVGFLDEIVVTRKCALCRLVTAAISGSFSELPLVYASATGTWSIEKTVNGRNIKKEYNPLEGGVRFFRQRVGLTFLGLQSIDDNSGCEIGIRISLSCNAGPEFTMKECSTIPINGKLFLPSIRVLDSDVHLVPAKVTRIPTGRQLQPTQADLKAIRESYLHCRKWHGQPCENSRSGGLLGEGASSSPAGVVQQPQPKNMLVIDVKQMRITPLPANTRYLALSYMWGRKPFLQLTTSNSEQLKRKGSLSEQDLPRTIDEAIKLVSMLDERYLWVDALCIVQDDSANKIDQITQMDRIYLCAAMTIASAGGSDAYSGLSGFSPGSRRTQQTVETIGGVRFVVMSPPLLDLLDGLEWHSRGWTYQEFMLSKRVLFFTPQLVFYICALQSFAEDHYRPPVGSTYVTRSKAKPSKAVEADMPYDIDERHRINMRREFRYAQNFHAYKLLVEDLSTRNLTYEGDALKSMTGVLQAMSMSRPERYICGLPSSMLEWALLWQPKGPLIRRGTTVFPSWSWIGWEGPVKYINYPGPEGIEIMIRDWQLLTPEAEGPTKAKSASLSKLFKKQSLNEKQPTHPSTPVPRTLLPYQPIVHCISPIWTPTTWLPWKTTPGPQNIPNYPERIRSHQSAMDAAGPLIESGILHFSTTISTFTVSTSPLPNGYSHFPASDTGSYRITDARNTWVGTVHLTLAFAKSLGGSYCRAEFIALSRTHVANEETDTLSVGQNTFDTRALRELDQKARATLMVNVMWVRWKGEIAERVAVGQIHAHAWAASQPGVRRVRLG